MLTLEAIQEYKKRLEKDLKETRDWLATHSEMPNQEELRGYDEPYRKAEVIVKRKNGYRQKKEREDDIISALERFANGTFGICIDSPKDLPHKIEEGRLDANPAYKRCCEDQIKHLKAENEKLRSAKAWNNNAIRQNKKNKLI